MPGRAGDGEPMIDIDLLMQAGVWSDDSGADHAVLLMEDASRSTLGALGPESVGAFVSLLLERGMDLVLDVTNPVLPQLPDWTVTVVGEAHMLVTWFATEPLAADGIRLPIDWLPAARIEQQVLVFGGTGLSLCAGGEDAGPSPERACRDGTLAGGIAGFVEIPVES